jgi:hypothetical protein
MNSLKYREAKHILEKQEEARDVINQYRGIETLGDRLGMKSNRELILTLCEIEENAAVVEVMTHLKALYPDQWDEAGSSPAPKRPGEISADEKPASRTAAEPEANATEKAQAVS